MQLVVGGRGGTSLEPSDAGDALSGIGYGVGLRKAQAHVSAGAGHKKGPPWGIARGHYFWVSA